MLNINGRRSVRPQDRDQLEITSDGRLLEHGERDALYLNDGKGRFSDVSERLVPADVSNGLVVFDLSGDARPTCSRATSASTAGR
ncbi:MAG: hypothetical protein HC859_15695 [Bacteroidia bacterium]|nr:hypothetical protein [Bacteroidia bacterium]